ncbi:hypothetical protein [Streptomyces ossamyceticus]|uniref:Uncharacterized protein n=1 Tax=Streptomyces ossamyceticus TaxID=249581 RepID=A0ABV2V2A2_9ACTN
MPGSRPASAGPQPAEEGLRAARDGVRPRGARAATTMTWSATPRLPVHGDVVSNIAACPFRRAAPNPPPTSHAVEALIVQSQ